MEMEFNHVPSLNTSESSDDDTNSWVNAPTESNFVSYTEPGGVVVMEIHPQVHSTKNLTYNCWLLELVVICVDRFDGIFCTTNGIGSDIDVSSPSEDSNKIYDPGICIEVEATRFRSTLSPVIDTLLTFSSGK
ncbi:hypothetical protein Tco_1229611 [Tanacetum coccineum]